jgi:hypothetical protein
VSVNLFSGTRRVKPGVIFKNRRGAYSAAGFLCFFVVADLIALSTSATYSDSRPQFSRGGWVSSCGHCMLLILQETDGGFDRLLSRNVP